MDAFKTLLPEVIILKPKVFKDDRGYFKENYNAKTFSELTGFKGEFVQDNLSESVQGVLRGLHYQIKQPQGKLVNVIKGCVFDIAVDIRKSSPNYGKWVGTELSEDNHHQLWIPPGFAHGFLVLTKTAIFSYKTTDFWAPEWERSINWKCPDLNIEWPLNCDPILAKKDLEAPFIKDAETYQ